MTLTSASPTEILRELLSLPPDQRRARAAQRTWSRAEVVALGDEAERAVFSEVARGLEATELVVTISDVAGAGRARARRARGQALAYAGRLVEALATCREAMALAQDAGEPIEAARARLAALHPLGELGRYDEAVALGEAAREMLLQAGEPQLAGRADLNLGVIHQNRDDPTRALRHLDRARDALAGEPVLMGYIENNRGEALVLLGEFAQAEAAFHRALQTCEKSGATAAAAIAEGNLADLAARRGQLPQALHFFERARQRLERDVAAGHLARLLMEQAEALASLGMAKDAVSAYQEALPRLQAQGLAWESARAEAGLGKTLLRLGETGLADAHLARAAKSYIELKQPLNAARTELIRAEAALAQGRIEDAQELLEHAGGQLGERPIDEISQHYLAARVLAARGDVRAALRRLDPAIHTAGALGVAPLLADLLHERGRLQRRLGHIDAAVDDFEAAIQQVERVRGSIQAERIRAGYLTDRLALHEDAALAWLESRRPGRIRSLLRVAELAKSRILQDSLRAVGERIAAGAPACAEAGPADRLAELREELNALYSQRAEWAHRREHVLDERSWRTAVAQREQELTAIEDRIANLRSPAALGATPRSAETIQAALAPNAALIEYFQAGDELIAIVVTPRRIAVHRALATRDAAAGLVERVRFQLTRALRPGATDGPRAGRLLEDLRRELAAAHEALVAPLRADLEGVEQLVFVPHGALHLLPLHALWDGERYLIERAVVSYAPSAAIYADLASATDAADEPAANLIVSVPDEHAPGIAQEARQLDSVLPGARVLDGPRASAAAVVAASERAGLLHFACHASFSADRPTSSGLRLADRWLTAGEVPRLRLDADLVVLSGCNTGRSGVKAGDELTGLLRSFLGAGARSVLATLWALNDQSGFELMRDFYTMWFSLGRGAGKAAALRAAQLQRMRQQPHPVFWAPFFLVGKP